jgi:predicted phosphodiesterase
MRYLILSDIHGNIEALDTVLAAVDPTSYDATLVLGDLVGYGADPNAVIDRVRGLAPRTTIRGNHDKVAAGVEDAEGFNTIARSAVSWTQLELSQENTAYLAALQQGPQVVDELIEICHGTPYDEDAYVFDELDALRALESATRPVCLFGHTHIPVVFTRSREGLEVDTPDGEPVWPVTIVDDRRYLINPGSVGQPRDGDPRAAFALVDTTARRVDLRRIAYPIQATQQKVIRAGLPDVLARRLAVGR